MSQNILEKYKKLLEREISFIVHFNDVFSEREVDFDAELTTTMRNLGTLSDTHFPIGKNPKLADYGVNLLNDLLEEQERILKIIKEKSGKSIKTQLSDQTKSPVAIINKADRNNKTTKNNRNGEDFHLAITDNGLEIYVVPLSLLQTLETHNKILALYKIENEKLVVTDGNKEQFRSSIIATTRYFQEILTPVFQYENKKELLEAKRLGKHPKVIPTQESLIEFAYKDKFGNVRLSIKNPKEFATTLSKIKLGDNIKICINNKCISAIYTSSLKEIPEGKLGIYQNIADEQLGETFYVEVVKKSADCNIETETAYTILKSLCKKLESAKIDVKT